MLTIICVLVPFIAWGLEDVFVKVSADRGENFYLKIPVCYAVVFLPVYIICTFLSESGMNIIELILNNKLLAFTYLLYAFFLYASFAGAKYLEISIMSPVENIDGGITVIMLILYFFITGKHNMLDQYVTVMNMTGVLLSLSGVLFLAILQNRYADGKQKNTFAPEEKKYRYGAWAFLFPIAFCLVDGFSVFVDSIILGAAGEQSIGEMDYLRILCFYCFCFGVIAWFLLLKRTKKIYIPFHKESGMFFLIGVCELIASTVYPFAIAGSFSMSIIIFNSYSIVTILLSRIFLKERLTKLQYLCVAIVLIGIILVTLSDIAL